MTAFVLVAGSLFREAQQKTSKSGNPYVVATIKSTSGTEAEFWSILAFSESAQAELIRLAVGEKLSVQGSLKIEIYDKDGVAKVSRTIMADAVLALKPPPRERKPKPEAPRRESSFVGASPGPDDSIPF